MAIFLYFTWLVNSRTQSMSHTFYFNCGLTLIYTEISRKEAKLYQPLYGKINSATEPIRKGSFLPPASIPKHHYCPTRPLLTAAISFFLQGSQILLPVLAIRLAKRFQMLWHRVSLSTQDPQLPVAQLLSFRRIILTNKDVSRPVLRENLR